MISFFLLQVTGYGWQGKGDGNDVWRVVAVGEKTGSKIKVLRYGTRIRKEDHAFWLSFLIWLHPLTSPTNTCYTERRENKREERRSQKSLFKLGRGGLEPNKTTAKAPSAKYYFYFLEHSASNSFLLCLYSFIYCS
jgi:hypothetical protein